MERRTNVDLIEEWIDRNGPDGAAKLALGSKVSTSMINKIRKKDGSQYPKKASTRGRICKFLQVSEDQLFPARLNQEAS